MKKRNDMGVRVYGCMPNGGGERKMRPHKENDVPGVGAMGGAWVMISRMCTNRSLLGIMNLCDSVALFGG